jgi:hypothetical protein
MTIFLLYDRDAYSGKERHPEVRAALAASLEG